MRPRPRGPADRAKRDRALRGRAEIAYWNFGRKKKLAAAAAKNRPRRGRPGIKEVPLQKGCLLFKGIGKIFVCAKTPTRGCGVTKVLRIYIVGERRRFYVFSPPNVEEGETAPAERG